MKKILPKLFVLAAAGTLLCCSDDSSTSASNESANNAYSDTLVVFDTLKTTDTLLQFDTISKFDTIFSIDTVTQTKKITKIDTIVKVDTITVTKTKLDTLYDSIYVMKALNDSTLDSIYAKIKEIADSTTQAKHDTITTVKTDHDTVFVMETISDSTLDTMYAKIKDIVDTSLANKTITDTVEKTIEKTDTLVKTENLHYLEAIKAIAWPEGKVYTIGHQSPDADAVFSAIAYAALMDSLGYDVEARMTAKPNFVTSFIADLWGITLPEILDDATDKNLILVDHSEYVQSVKGANKARIVQVIDHHGIGSVTESNMVFSKILPVGSTCTIVYTTFKEVGVTIDANMAKILLAGIIDDTRDLKKSTTTEMDKAAYEALAEISGLGDDLKDNAEDILGANRYHEGMSATEIYTDDVKKYESKLGCDEESMKDIQYSIGSIDWYEDSTLTSDENYENFNTFAIEILGVMKTYLNENNLTYAFSKLDKHVIDTEDEDGFSKEGTYILYYGEGSEGLVTEAFQKSEDLVKLLNKANENEEGENHEFEIIGRLIAPDEGGIVKTNSDMNRKKVVQPRIEASLNYTCVAP